jgi:hypothetical protein
MIPKIDQTSLIFNTSNSLNKLEGLALSTLGTTLYTRINAIKAKTAAAAKHYRQLRLCPTSVTMGTPTIVAMVKPINTFYIKLARLPSGAMSEANKIAAPKYAP